MKKSIKQYTKSTLKKILPHRISAKPGKTLLRLFLSKDMRLSQNMKVGIDVACASMSDRCLFKTEKYIGIDIDKERLREGVSKYPDATAVCSRIEDIQDLEGDIVVCVQTINTNKHFDPTNAIPVIQKLVDIVRPEGTLIFNVGNKGSDLRSMELDIDNVLNGKFSKIIKRKYGAFHSGRNATSRRMSYLLAVSMYLFPLLRTMSGKQYTKLYYCCIKKYD